MSIFCGVVLADDEVGRFGGKIIFVLSSKFDDFVAQIGLSKDTNTSQLTCLEARPREGVRAHLHHLHAR